MERLIKLLTYTLIISGTIITLCPAGLCEEPTMQQLTTPQNVSYDDCTKDYNMPAEKLYYLTLASISANRFEIKEMQSKTGYILFKAGGKEYLASVVYYGLNKSMLKITPVNNNYYFAPGIVSNIFKYIDINVDTKVEQIPKT